MIWYLPVGLALSIVLSLLFPIPGAWLNELGCLPFVIALIFVINGIQTTVNDVKVGDGFSKTLASAFFINLIVAPIIGWMCFYFLNIEIAFIIGLVVMCVMPPTLSSCVVLTRLVGGNAQWSLWFTLLLNFIGILTIPITLSLIIGKGIHIDGWNLLFKLTSMVALPFAVGMLLRHYIDVSGFIGKLKHWPTLLVISGAWMTLSSSQQELLSVSFLSLIVILALSGLIHCLLLLSCFILQKWAKFPFANYMALLFTASQKTMPIAVSVVVAIDSKLGLAIIVCVIFHTLQMLIDSTLAAYISKRKIVNS